MRLFQKFFICLFIICLAVPAFGQSEYRTHMLVKVTPENEARLKALYRITQLDIIPGETREEPYVAAYPEDLELLESEGYAYTIIHGNLEKFYADRLGHRLDDMGGYHTYSEIVTELDNIHRDHPTIATEKFTVGWSLEGRQIWCMKISDNPNDDEDEPEVFFNSLIHAREPAPMEALLYFMNFLTDGYGIDPEVNDLVDNREMFFIPCMNPDGYVYNEQTNPNGGGMWRKNRRNNGGGCWGVDLNRNWGYTWGLDDNGSSPNPCDETYRGTAEFSEPVTDMVRQFINSRHFVCGDDYHSYGNWLLYPWSTSYFDGDGLTEDNDIFEMIGDSMSYLIHEVNGAWYTPGTAWQNLYNVNGGSIDWEYGDQVSKPKMFQMSTEVGGGGDGFWPSESRILPLAQENLPANMFLARIAASLVPPPYAVAYAGQCQNEWSGDGDGVTEPGEGLELAVTLKNVGTQTLTNLHGQLATSDPHAVVVQDEADWPEIVSYDFGESTTDFQVSVLGTCPPLHLIPLALHMTADGGLDTMVELAATVGIATLADNVEGGTGGWTSGGTGDLWHISTRRASSPTHSWYCGNESTGQYNSGMHCWLLSDTLILPAGAQLSWDHWYSLETGYDYGYVEINTGAGWVSVATPANGASGTWIHEDVDLGIACGGTMARIRFRMFTDEGVTDEGWYVDNIEVGPPPEFTLSNPSVSPAFGTSDSTFTFSVVYTNLANDPPVTAEVYVDDVAHAVTTIDPDYTDGALFTYETMLGTGRHDYYFYFVGTEIAVRDPLAGSYAGPFVGDIVACYDFETEQGWTVGDVDDDATTGIWERVDPEGTFEYGRPVQPEDDHTPAPGINCYVTDGTAGSSSGSYDVDGGKTTLFSPVWDLSSYTSTMLELWTWYSNDEGNNPGQDDFVIDISSDGGGSWVSMVNTNANWEYWKDDYFFLEDYVALTNQVKLRIIASDESPGSLVEAAVDDVGLYAAGVGPEAPTDLVIISEGDDIHLYWQPSSGATGYRIDCASEAFGSFEEVGTVSAGETDFVHVGAAQANVRVFYRVVATN
jgi:hypothetical protein